ncbi:MAG: hypothetical protein AAF441_13750 [Pseudomonadota bacterium]
MRGVRHLILLLISVVWLSAPVLAESKNWPKLFTNQRDVEAWSGTARVDLDDTKAVLRFVLASLPDEVKVYPTENYYYFYFYQDGVRYSGNLRLSPELAENGRIMFAYFLASTPWGQDRKDYGKILGKEDGVEVTPAGPLAYSVKFEDRTIVFRFNDLRDVKPPEEVMADGETYIGPVFDESGIRFFLLFDEKRKLFHYVLDETVRVNDRLRSPKGMEKIFVGWRTGFAFYAQEKPKRKILIGVYRANAEANTSSDGPFDQLPDNFIRGNTLRDAFIAQKPDLKGTIDRFGNRKNTMEREMIAPYIEYEILPDLELAQACARDEPDVSVADCMDAKAPAE